MIRYIAVLICVIVFVVGRPCAYAQDKATMLIFYSSSCHECIRVENELMPSIAGEFKDELTVEYCNIADIENYKLLLGLAREYGVEAGNILPVFYINGRFLSKKSISGDSIRQFILASSRVTAIVKPQQPATQSLLERFKTFRPLAVAGAGIIDGINPCAFTVIVFFISFLALQGYRKRELIAIGSAFITAVFLTYLLLGIGLFGFLYRLKGFWAITRVFNFTVGAVSVILGLLCIYDIFKFKATAKPQDMILQLPKMLKQQIHKVIGMHYRMNKRGIFPLLLSALVTGFLVSILEAICTGQMYLPTIAFVLKTTHFKLEAFGYLVLYNLMFIIPLFVILIFALWGVTSEQFSKFLKKHMLLVKVLMAAMFFGLGIFLVWRA